MPYSRINIPEFSASKDLYNSLIGITGAGWLCRTAHPITDAERQAAQIEGVDVQHNGTVILEVVQLIGAASVPVDEPANQARLALDKLLVQLGCPSIIK